MDPTQRVLDHARRWIRVGRPFAGRLGKPEGSAESAAARRIEQLEGELAQRAQVIGELTIANGILKKLQTRSH